MPKRFLALLIVLPLVSLLFFWHLPISSADELDDLNKQISDLTTALNQSVAATKPLESQLTAMQQQITGIKNRVKGNETDKAVKKKNIDSG
jgi:septal ring factor EnvC (AmiA/AmiB activator)